MNESWKQAEADAHEAKAEALSVALDALRGVALIVSHEAFQLIQQTDQALDHAREKHEKAAALARAKVPA